MAQCMAISQGIGAFGISFQARTSWHHCPLARNLTRPLARPHSVAITSPPQQHTKAGLRHLALLLAPTAPPVPGPGPQAQLAPERPDCPSQSPGLGSKADDSAAAAQGTCPFQPLHRATVPPRSKAVARLRSCGQWPACDETVEQQTVGSMCRVRRRTAPTSREPPQRTHGGLWNIPKTFPPHNMSDIRGLARQRVAAGLARGGGNAVRWQAAAQCRKLRKAMASASMRSGSSS
jgi:hypothetical protein